jgi:two-component system, LytTR family, sensor kinase
MARDTNAPLPGGRAEPPPPAERVEPASEPRPFRWTARSLAVLLLGATVFGLLEALQVYTGSMTAGRPIDLARSVAATLPSWYVHAALVPPTWYAAARLPLERGRVLRSLVLLIPIGIVYSALSIAISAGLSDFVLSPGGLPVPFRLHLVRLLSIYFMVTTVYYWATVGAYYIFDYRRRVQEHRRTADVLALRASRLEASLAQASLASLRQQLNPHFLFNTLNTIAVLSRKGEAAEVTRLIGRLSDLLRMSLDNARQIVTVADEVAMLDCYLQIEQMRFGDRLTVRRLVEPEVLQAEAPSMLLQPLVENALRHGIARKPGPGVVEVRIERQGDQLLVQVYDTGPGFPPRPGGGNGSGSGTGLGLRNTRARIEQLYGAHGSLLTHSPAGGGAIVRAAFPFRLRGDEQTHVNGAGHAYSHAAG